MYHPNYGTRPPHNGREVRAAVTLDSTALSSLPLLQIDSLQIVTKNMGNVYEACSKEETKSKDTISFFDH